MKIPTATYRLQLHSQFPFSAVEAIADYLNDLGVSAVYASPIFKARAGSTHGYDVVDPTQINPELGTSDEFDQLIARLQQHNIGWVQDIVPNHMAYDSNNHWLMDVLENGSDSDFYDFFDIEWNHAYESFKGRVLAPLLGNFYGRCLEAGEIQLSYDESGLSVNYYSLKFPVRIESYTRFITYNLGHLGRTLGRKHPDFIKLLGILYLIKNIPVESKGRERYDQVMFAKSLLWELYTSNADIQAFFDQNVRDFNGQSDQPEPYQLLDDLLSEQLYRLSFWKVGAEEINYRRFFTVNELISVKVEELKVFNKSHTFIEECVKSGKFTGLRIDHIDGLYNPTEYLYRLREKMGDVYITVEKILELTEKLPPNWPIQGTSGYESLNYINGVFCNVQNERNFQDIYVRFTGINQPYETLVFEKKHLIIDKNLTGDVDNLAQRLKTIASQTRQGSDFTANGLKRALSEVLARFSVYRTYISSEPIKPDDRTYIEAAIASAETVVPLLLNELHFIQRILLHEDESRLTNEQVQERLQFVMKFQQLTGPLMAKGVEDTLLYIYNRLLSLNEVGGNPGHFGISLDTFHEFSLNQRDRWPYAMNATATHDTKRGEDVRARLNVLSELPDQWEQQIWTWSEMNRSFKQTINQRPVPDTNDEYFLYQTLLGAYPFSSDEFPQFVERLKNYVIKAVREAKAHTAWLTPDVAYEDSYLTFIDKIMETDSTFLESFLPFQRQIADYGIWNSLSQVVLKYAAPGVPDLYQGCELWDLSLVDPDNRRPVDYDRRKAMLRSLPNPIDPSALHDLLTTRTDGRVKLFLTHRLLQARQQYAQLFLEGDYQPLTVSGPFAEHIVAFARRLEDQVAIALAPRFFTQLMAPGELPLGDAVWQDTRLELPDTLPTQWRNVLTDQTVESDRTLSVEQVLQSFPVAVLIA